jgi:ABC-type cobalamin/Fe3+-siderophores transport system ATPase subunit
VAVVAQESTVEFDFTVLEMVMIGRTPHKRAFDRDDEADRAVVLQAIERVGCQHLVDRSFNTLSGGEKQRVLIARAVAQGADHLILDEPTNHLDIRYQMEILELVSELEVTVLAALHDLSLAALFCDSVYLLSDGRIVTGGIAGVRHHHRDGPARLRSGRPDCRASRDRHPPPHPALWSDRPTRPTEASSPATRSPSPSRTTD